MKYITEDGQILQTEYSVIKDAPAGQVYTTWKKDFEGYTFVSMANGSAAANGTVMGCQDLHVTYVYRPVTTPEPVPQPGNVYVNYIREDGTVLLDEFAVKQNALTGEEYRTEQKIFIGYEFVKMADGSAPASGHVIGGQDLHVTYVYRRMQANLAPTPETGNVFVKYITEDGKVLVAESIVKLNAPGGELYNTEQMSFAGYEFVKMADNSAAASGAVKAGQDLHVVYVYRPVNPNSALTPPAATTTPNGINTPNSPELEHQVEVPYVGETFDNSSYVLLALASAALALIIKAQHKNKLK